jgi:hypothetical protein
MGDAGRYEPHVARPQVVNQNMAVLVYDGQTHITLEDIGPFGFLVPMQFANDTGIEAHVDASHRLRDRQFPHRHLAGPSAVFKAVVRHPEGEFQVWYRAAVRLGRNKYVGVLLVEQNVPRTRIRRAECSANGLFGLSCCHELFLFAGEDGGTRAGSTVVSDTEAVRFSFKIYPALLGTHDGTATEIRSPSSVAAWQSRVSFSTG